MPLLLQVTQFACSSVHVVPVTHSPTTTWSGAGHCARHTRLERYLLHTMSAKTDSTPSSDSLFLVVRSTAHFRTNWWCTALHNSEQTLVHSTAHFRTNSGTQHCPLQNKQTNYLCPNTALEQTHTDVQTKPQVSGELALIPAAEGLYCTGG